ETTAMVGKHVALTLIVGGGVGCVLWKNFSANLTLMQIAGLILLVIGFVLWTAARFQLGTSFTVTPQARQLVSTGIYSRIRNPIYICRLVHDCWSDSVAGTSLRAADICWAHPPADLACPAKKPPCSSVNSASNTAHTAHPRGSENTLGGGWRTHA